MFLHPQDQELTHDALWDMNCGRHMGVTSII